MRIERAAPPCSAPFSTIFSASRLSSAQSSTGPVVIAAKWRASLSLVTSRFSTA